LWFYLKQKREKNFAQYDEAVQILTKHKVNLLRRVAKA
jgi:hypothetical protein